MRRLWGGFAAGCMLMLAAAVQADEAVEDTDGWQRIDSRYCTVWLHPDLKTKKVSQQVSIWRIRPQVKAVVAGLVEEQFAAKCDTIFRRAEELLDMYPPGIHVTVRIEKDGSQISSTHAARYGFGTEAIAFYVLENNTIYTTASEISESVLAHEMAHCIIDHYFGIRPPRKIEEMLAMYVDEHLQD